MGRAFFPLFCVFALFFAHEVAAAEAIEVAVRVERLPLPYAQNALEPFISAKTVHFHYDKHHKGYVDKLHELVRGTDFAQMPLETVIRKTSGKPEFQAIFNNAAQVWNHDFYWQSMKPGGGGKPRGKLADLINRSFGSFDVFKERFVDAAAKQFGSGYAWLIVDGENLKIITTGNADNTIAHGQKALLTADLWEHSYYLDYQNERKRHVTQFLERLANWEFAAQQLDAVSVGGEQAAAE